MISTNLWGLVAADPTAAHILRPQDVNDPKALALNTHLTAQRRRELAEFAADQGHVWALPVLLAAQTGVPDVELAHIVRAGLKRRRYYLAETVGQNPALFPTPNPDDTDWWDTVPYDYALFQTGDGPAWGELPPPSTHETMWMDMLSHTVDEPGHPWHASDGFVIDTLTSVNQGRRTSLMTERMARRLLRRPAVTEWVVEQVLRRSALPSFVKRLTMSLLGSPYVPRNEERRRLLLLRAAAAGLRDHEAAGNPLVSIADLEFVARNSRSWGTGPGAVLADASFEPSELTDEHLAQLRTNWGKRHFPEWALAAEAGSPIIPWVLRHQGLGPVANELGVHAASRLVDKLAVTHPDEAARHRQRMAEQGWAHPLRTTLSPAEAWEWARAEPAADPLSARAGDLHAAAQPRTTVRLPDEVSGLLDTPEAWQRLAHVAEQYPDQPLGAALLLARDTVAAA